MVALGGLFYRDAQVNVQQDTSVLLALLVLRQLDARVAIIAPQGRLQESPAQLEATVLLVLYLTKSVPQIPTTPTASKSTSLPARTVLLGGCAQEKEL